MLGHRFPTKKLSLIITAALCLLLCPALHSQATAATEASAGKPAIDANLDQRLERLVQDLEEKRQQMHIPGMAIAIVQDDALVLARGFGVSDLEEKTPITPETIFAIGSSTKAFTSTLVGMLIDEGVMDWDDPVTKYLPYFKLAIDTEEADAAVTLRDLLAHRTGFTRMGILWAGNTVDREEVLRTAINAEPWSKYRGDFFYNNVTYMAAGVASEKAGNSSWEAMIQKRIFDPLDMQQSSTSVAQAQKNKRLSLGYLWQDELNKHSLQPMRKLQAIAPSGAINSNVIDMSKWLRLQLGKGEFQGKTLLSDAQHQETWNPQIKIGNGIDYGLGWMLRSIDGHRVVEHGGNIDGFSAQVTLVPDANLGFVLLANLSAAPLQGLSSSLVVKALLGEMVTDMQSVAGASTAEDLAIYAGKYEANFGPFKEAYFTVSANDNVLAIDVPGQTNYELKSPDEDGKRYFALTDQIAVSFDHAEDGSVVGVKMYQGGMTFELPREGVVQVAEIPLEDLEPFLGTYHLEEGDKDFTVLIANQHLAVDVPGEMVFELLPPDDDGKRGFRATDRVAVSFQQADGGVVETMTVHEGDKVRILPRVEPTDTQELPTLDELFARRSDLARGTPSSVKLRGRVRMVHSGVAGTFRIDAKGLSQLKLNMDFGSFGWSGVVVNEAAGWTESSFSPTVALEGRLLQQARIESPLAWLGDFRQLFTKSRVLRADILDGKAVYVLGLYSDGLPRLTAYLDSKTADVVKTEMSVIHPSVGLRMETVNLYQDFREVEGRRIAFRTSSTNQFTGELIVELDKVDFDVELADELFQGPATDAAP